MDAQTLEDARKALGQVQEPLLHHELASLGLIRGLAHGPSGWVADIGLIAPGHPARDVLEQAVRAALAPFDAPVEVRFELAIPRKPPRADLDRVPGVKHVLAVGAGKGGVGKSTVSVNLALALQDLGAKVGILDADIYGPSVPHMLGPAEIPADRSTSGERIIPAQHRGLKVMSVDFFVEAGRAVVWRGPMIHKLLNQFLEDVDWGELDYLIIDLPPGTGDAQLSLSQLVQISGAVMVTTPQEVALLDVRKAIDMLKKVNIPLIGIIENMSGYRCPACGHHDDILASGGGRRLANELGAPLLGELPLDRGVSHGGETGVPIVSGVKDGTHATVLRGIAVRIAVELARAATTGPKRSAKLRTV